MCVCVCVCVFLCCRGAGSSPSFSLDVISSWTTCVFSAVSGERPADETVDLREGSYTLLKGRLGKHKLCESAPAPLQRLNCRKYPLESTTRTIQR